ncbi:MAG: DUF4230 domain-containing protein [Anaerolineae bacterium]
MNTQHPPQIEGPPPAQQRSVLPWILLALLLIPLIGCLVFTVATVGGATRAIDLVRNVLDGGEIMVIDRQPAIITQMRELGRLESASYTVEKVLEGGVDQGNDLLNLLLGDRLLFIAHGEVIAGVDLTELADKDVVVSDDRQSVTLRLPPARVLTQRLDNELSRVYDREQGLLTKGDPDLESRVRQEAESAVLLAACEGGILAQAELNAQRQVQILLLAVEFREIEFLPARTGSDVGCP